MSMSGCQHDNEGCTPAVYDTGEIDPPCRGMVSPQHASREKERERLGELIARLDDYAAPGNESHRKFMGHLTWMPLEYADWALLSKALRQADAPVGWVSVDERLPETRGHYLVSDEGVVEIIWFQNDEETGHQARWWADDALEDSHPTHWMPLPAAPRPAGSAE